MPDMLVKLLELPPSLSKERLDAEGIDIRRAMALNRRMVAEWVRSRFGDGWASECETAFLRQSISCFIAVKSNKIIGFACYEATCWDFFGPMGFDEAFRGLGMGTHLLFTCLQAMRDIGYAYAIIGGADPVAFYEKTVGATIVGGSSPGIFKDMLKAI